MHLGEVRRAPFRGTSPVTLQVDQMAESASSQYRSAAQIADIHAREWAEAELRAEQERQARLAQMAEVELRRRESATSVPPTHVEIPTTPATLTRTEIMRVQSILAQLGYSPGFADGELGRRTRAAIASFEHDLGLPISETASRNLLSLLESQSTRSQEGQRPTECVLSAVMSDADYRACGITPPPSY